jgi:hypothetical protein
MRFDVGSLMLVDENFLIAITGLTLHTCHGIFIKNGTCSDFVWQKGRNFGWQKFWDY